MQLFYAPDITPPYYTLSEEESKHAVRVLRLAIGDELYITDGKGNMHLCRVMDDNAKRCVVEVVSSQAEYEKSSYALTMAVAPTKLNERYEWFLEKATEVGVARFVPIECQHSERRVVKRERQMKVVTSAVKQSLKGYHPRLDELTSFADFISQPFEDQKFIAHCHAESEGCERKNFAQTLQPNKDVVVLIGPEGDFSPEEVAMAIEAGFVPITLGHQRLRTETAALVAVVVCATINGMAE